MAPTATSLVIATSAGVGPTATLLAIPKLGGSPSVVSSMPGTTYLSIAEADGEVFFTTFGDQGPYGDVCQVPLAGGPVQILAAHQFRPNGVAADATNVYWTVANTSGPPSSEDGKVMRIARTGGTPEELASGQWGPFAIAVDATNVYFTNTASDSSETDGNISSVPILGGSVSQLVSNVGDSFAIAADSANVYFTDEGDGNSIDGGSLDSVPIGGGSPEILSSGFGGYGYSQTGAVALDATHVYFVATSFFDTPPGYELFVRSKIANDTRPFQATHQINSAVSVATDPTCVYWRSATQVWKAPLTLP